MAFAVKNRTNCVTIGFEQQLWTAADKKRGHMDPSEYKHVAFGPISLKIVMNISQKVFSGCPRMPVGMTLK